MVSNAKIPMFPLEGVSFFKTSSGASVDKQISWPHDSITKYVTANTEGLHKTAEIMFKKCPLKFLKVQGDV